MFEPTLRRHFGEEENEDEDGRRGGCTDGVRLCETDAGETSAENFIDKSWRFLRVFRVERGLFSRARRVESDRKSVV